MCVMGAPSTHLKVRRVEGGSVGGEGLQMCSESPWLWGGRAGSCFCTPGKGQSDELRLMREAQAGAWGALGRTQSGRRWGFSWSTIAATTPQPLARTLILSPSKQAWLRECKFPSNSYSSFLKINHSIHFLPNFIPEPSQETFHVKPVCLGDTGSGMSTSHTVA